MGGRSDEFTFLHRELTGDGTLVVRIADFRSSPSQTKAGLMLRESLAPRAKHVFLHVSQSGQLEFQRRATSGALTSTSRQTASAAGIWLKLERRAGTITGSWSSDGETWTPAGSAEVEMNAVVSVGAAVTSGTSVAAARVQFEALQLTPLADSGRPLPERWLSADVGRPLEAGAAAFDAGTFALRASRSDSGGAWDEFHFVHTRADGDLDIVARVRTVGGTNGSSVAGVMIRESLAPDAPHASMLVSATGDMVFRRRSLPGTSSIDSRQPTGPGLRWVRLAVRASVVTAYESPDGASWNEVGSEVIALASPFYVGFAVTSANTDDRVDANIDSLELREVSSLETAASTVTVSPEAGGMTALATAPITAAALPTGWTSVDVGSPTPEGNATTANGTFTITAGGTDIWGGSDQFHFAYQPVTGDVDIVARVASLGQTNAWSKAGVMVRASLAANAAHASMFATGTAGMAFQRRQSTGANSVHTAGSQSSAPRWVKLTRRGSTVTAYESANGTTWTQVGTQTLTLPSTFYVGLAVTSHDSSRSVSATFDNLSVQAPTANQSPTVSLTAPANGATFTAPATVTVSANASDTDGTIARVEFYQGTTLIGSDTSSPYSISWSNVSAGSYTLTARATDNGGATTTSAARSITVNGPANQPPAVSLTAPANGATFTAPATVTVSANASDTDGTIARVEFYQGTTLIGSDTTSPYSVSWSNVAAGSYSLTARAIDDDGAATTSAARSITVNGAANQPPTVSLTAPANGASFTAPAGITVSANAADTGGSIARVDFYQGSTQIGSDTTSPYSITWSNVAAGTYSLTARATDNGGATTTSAAHTITVTGTGGLPSGWTAVDVGSPTPAGSTTVAGDTFTIAAGGADIWGTSDQFHFAYRQVTGDIDVVARLATLGQTNEYSKAGVMIRTALTGGAAHASMFLLRNHGTWFTRRPTTGGTSVSTAGGIATMPLWVKLSRRGSTITAYESANGTTWTQVGTQTLTLPSSFYVGLAVTSHDSAASVTATLDNVSVQAPTANQSPTVSLTAPANGATFTAPATVTVSASASDTDGTIARVEFYQGTTLIGSDTTSPYSISWSNVSAGSYTLTARATDNGGATTTSSARSITVTGSANQPPAVSLTAPANGATFTAPATVTVSANASDTDGTIARVEFYQGTTLIGSDTTSPYSVSWSNVAAGSYSLTARAIDNSGATTTSAARTITVNATSTQRQAIFTASADHGTLVNSYLFEVFAAGANPSTATPIRTQDLGKPAVVSGEITADITATFTALAPGNYQATVSAVGSGGTSRSSAATFTR